MGILVARDAIRLQAEERRTATTIASVVALFAADRGVGALEGPARKTMIEPRLRPTRPANEPRISSQVLDVAPPTVLPAILDTMQPGALADAHRQIIVAAETSIGIDPLTRRVAFATVGVALELGV
jgi:hypothetical protein